jgi:hypothetical protein
MAFTAALQEGILSALMSRVYVSLHTSDPRETGANEVAGGGYRRQGPVSLAAGVNDIDLVWRNMPEGRLTHVGMWTDGGAFLSSGELDRRKTVNEGDTFVLFAGEARIAFS